MSSLSLPAIAVLIRVVLACGLCEVRGRADFETSLLPRPCSWGLSVPPVAPCRHLHCQYP